MKNKNYIFRFHNPSEEKEAVSIFLHTVIQANAKNIEALIADHIAANHPIVGKQQPLSRSVSSI